MTTLIQHSAPIFDDIENSIHPIQEIWRDIFGDNYEDEEELTPWLKTPEILLRWFQTEHRHTPLCGIIDLHDPEYRDLGVFGYPALGTDGGQLTGWRVAESVIVPMMMQGQIRYRVPLIFISSRPESLTKAREEAERSQIAEECLRLGIGLSFLAKPHTINDADGRALRRELVRLARDRMLKEGILEHSILELGIPRRDFDHLAAVRGLQQIWGLNDDEMAHILLFRDVGKYSELRRDGLLPSTEHWRRHVELLYGLKSRLSGLKVEQDIAERQEFDRAWLRERRVVLGNRSPLDILLTGDMEKLDLLLAFVEGIEIDPAAWGIISNDAT